MDYIASIQAPLTGADTRPDQLAQLAADLQPVLVALQSWATYDFTQAIFDDTLPVPDLNALDVVHLAHQQPGSARRRGDEHPAPLRSALRPQDRPPSPSTACWCAWPESPSSPTNTDSASSCSRKPAALLNSRAGAYDAHLISRRARKHYTGLVIITQDPVADLKLMGDKFITQQLIMPFEADELAREVARRAGIRVEDFDDIEEYFLAEPSPEHMRDPTAFDDDFDRRLTGAPDRGDREGYGFFVDEFRRPAPIRVAAEPDPVLHAAYDTTPGRAAA